jgi:hypothetical protein
VIPTIVNGKVYDPETAIKLFQQGMNKPVGIFGSQQEADAYARQRSEQIGRVRR